MENPSLGLMWMNSSSSPLYYPDSIFAKSGVSVRSLPTIKSGIVFSVEVPHGAPSVLEWLNPSHYGYHHNLDY